MARKTAADVHLELSVHEKECAERWKTAFNKFSDLEQNIKDLESKMSNGLTTLVVLLVGLLGGVVGLIIESFIVWAI